MKPSRKLLLCILILLSILFIFSNSLPDMAHSAQQSSRVLQLVKPFLELFVGEGNVTDHLVRKLAHVCEFALLGFFICIYSRKLFSVPAFALSLLVGVMDETIQLFTGRGSQVRDVWIDLLGACLGYLCGTVVLLLLRKGKAAKQRRMK